MNYLYRFSTKIGEITIVENNNRITHLLFDNEKFDGEFSRENTELIHRTYLELQKYLNGQSKTFDVTFNLLGTEFQKNVWKALQKIPYGETRSYKDIAMSIGSPKAYRAVGNACNLNPLPILIPCHRVISANGSLGGYKGSLEIKKYLFELEKTRHS